MAPRIDGAAPYLAVNEPLREGRGLPTRREFLQYTGAALASYLVAPVRTAHLRTGCWAPKNVQVCYRPWKVVAVEPGRNGIMIRKGPSFAAPVITQGGVEQMIPLGKHFGRQSKRIGNPCGTDPGPRPQANGWLWASGKSTDFSPGLRSGWVPFSVGNTTFAVGDNAFDGSTCGPSSDFDCRHPQGAGRSPCVSYNGCSSADVEVAGLHRYWTINDSKDLDDSEWYTVRYAPESVPIFWLLPGDIVYRHGYTSVAYGPQGPGNYMWSCIGIVNARWAPRGAGGWIRSDILSNPRQSAPHGDSSVPMPIPD